MKKLLAVALMAFAVGLLVGAFGVRFLWRPRYDFPHYEGMIFRCDTVTGRAWFCNPTEDVWKPIQDAPRWDNTTSVAKP
ncbi:MAG: hypothetical protein ABSA83_18725 [Verrucomicrobiota bacterium]|jgi:hypothetical protein